MAGLPDSEGARNGACVMPSKGNTVLHSPDRRLSSLPVTLAGVVLLAMQASGCVPGVCGDVFYAYYIVGEVRDAETGEVLGGLPVGVIIVADGEVVAQRAVDTDDAATTANNGTFDQRVSYSFGRCTIPVPGLSLPPPPDLTPDEVRVVVRRDGCQTTFAFEVTEQAFVDPTASDDMLELREPILLPPCEMDDADTAPAP
jgi:hypothetical protein